MFTRTSSVLDALLDLVTKFCDHTNAMNRAAAEVAGRILSVGMSGMHILKMDCLDSSISSFCGLISPAQKTWLDWAVKKIIFNEADIEPGLCFLRQMHQP